ncbi:hypothetical protein RND81_10G155500 [Saponaria officinalis]|uniref:No apical meristem-associated C-terminal domain-containing protein n=1 Tax=Saponaria officinalis TaxID=3572 RepID=A0AAW1I2P6_SAPOF
MDLNDFDFSSYANDDYSTYEDTQNIDLNQSTPIPTFTELISGSENNQNIDVFGNPILLSQLRTQDFVEEPPLFCAKKSNKSLTSTKNQSNSKTDARNWTEKEDEALMSAWILCSSNPILGKNQRTITRWNDVFELYEKSRTENQNQSQLGIRSIEGMKSRYKRLNSVVSQWVGCYAQVLNRPPASGTNIEDDIELAQKLFRTKNSNSDFVDFDVYNNVMSKHPKWSLPKKVTADTTSGSKRSRSEMDSSPSSVNFGTPSSVNVGTPSSGNVPTPSSFNVDTNDRPEGREAAKKKRNGKAPLVVLESIFCADDRSLISGNRETTKEQNEFRQKRIAADLEIEQIRAQKMKTKMEMEWLNTLLSQQNLNPKDQEMKNKLMEKYMSDI